MKSNFKYIKFFFFVIIFVELLFYWIILIFVDDFRIFCGDLGNEVIDEVLVRVFSRYFFFLKFKVVRDKRINKTKGYGFVSFKDFNDFV